MAKRKVDDCRECIHWIKGPLKELPGRSSVYIDNVIGNVFVRGIIVGGSCELGNPDHGYERNTNRPNNAPGWNLNIRVNDRPCRGYDAGTAHERAARLREKIDAKRKAQRNQRV